MVGKTDPISKANARRMRMLREVGCLACRINNNGVLGYPVELHHLLSGGRRIGHAATVPLCAWHHRGVVDTFRGQTTALCQQTLGYSFARNPAKFREMYGSDEELLDFANSVIAICSRS